ncbi:MAG TPA: sigma-70 family RNA polymerase sigma factor, partial [Burkholderiaceae bacterium]|nr:sigma-70 family RNA polymerase sigma factor [Burkholderiaceae bacterium]
MPPPKDLEQLLAQEPFVRGLARALVADDADEVVQQTWLQALGSRSSVREPRSWLARTVHNAARNLRRSRRRQLQRERAAAVSERLPSSAELLLREERRRALVLAVDALPAPLRTVVLLRWFEALPPRRIAADLGLPVATVWNQLRRALQLLRERLDAEHCGDRRAWLLPLVPVAAVNGTAALYGGLLVTAKTKAVAAGALVLFLALGLALRAPRGAALDTTRSAAVDPAVASAPHPALPPVEAPPPEREVVHGAAAATTGALVVHVRHVDSDLPVAQRPVVVGLAGSGRRLEARLVVTDAAGDARIDGLAPGGVYAADLLAGFGIHEQFDVTAGTTVEVTLRVRPGMQIDGVVVDEHGLPIAGALVEYAAAAGGDVRTAAVTDARGGFRLRDCIEYCLVGARAAGRTAAPMRLLMGRRDSTLQVRIELLQAGGQIDGVVVRTDGRPVARAWVCIGPGPFGCLSGDTAVPAIVRSDADGRFTALGLPPGTQPVRVLAAGAAPWEGSCEAVAGATTPLRVVVQDAIACTGVVRGRDRKPIAGVSVEVGESGQETFEYARTESAADGSFTLAGLRSGAMVRARH